MTDTGTAPVRTAVTDAPTYQWYAAGQWRDARDSSRFDVFEPYTGRLYAHVPDCGPEEAKIAIAAANDAFPAWADTPPAEKARLFFKAAEIVRRRRAEIAGILARETGSTIPFSAFQQDLVAATLEQAASWVYYPRARCCNPTSRTPTRSECGAPSASWPVSRPGTARTSSLGVPS
jgi:acyl-CoA reductase-like NAD-dependent aldehyde dehydrogenase